MKDEKKMKEEKKKKTASALQGAMLSPPYKGLVAEQPEQARSWPAIVTVPVAIVGIAVTVFGLVQLIKFAWFF